jgi:hypothetical protein
MRLMVGRTGANQNRDWHPRPAADVSQLTTRFSHWSVWPVPC